jgi:hypothetical protein
MRCCERETRPRGRGCRAGFFTFGFTRVSTIVFSPLAIWSHLTLLVLFFPANSARLPHSRNRKSTSDTHPARILCIQRTGFLSYEAGPPGQQFLHHALLEGTGLVAAGFERCNLRVHVRQYFSDGGLFGNFRQPHFNAFDG